MARPRREDSELVKRARAAAAGATSLEELRAAQAILLPAQTGAPLAQTAAMLGVGRASVGRLQAKFRRTPQAGRGRPVRRMFQAEARLGRLVRLRRCWAPSPLRPGVENGHERESVYVYGAVSPCQGELDWMICPEMNTGRMSGYLAPIHAAHPGEFIVMVADGASSHVAKELLVPENIRLRRLPPYAPELNPPGAHRG